MLGTHGAEEQEDYVLINNDGTENATHEPWILLGRRDRKVAAFVEEAGANDAGADSQPHAVESRHETAAAPPPAERLQADVAALAATGHVLSDGDIDFSVVVRCKTLALLGGGERRMAVLPAGERLSLAADETLAPAAELVGRFGLPRGALGPVGAHRAADVRVARCLAGRTIALGCGEVGQSLVADAEALVSCLGGRAVLF